jgi:uncharacterized membrane protein YdjX (TVP38/TMEM64 family)
MSSILQQFESWHDAFQRLGFLGWLAYVGGIVVLQMFFVPLSPVAIGAGAIFGFRGGWLAITLGTNLGAMVNFLIARYVARKAVTRYLAHHEKFRLIDAAVGREGGKIVALLRLCPLPFGLANYAYGLTAVRFWPYVLATFIAIIPANCFFVWLGASAHEGLEAVTGTGRPRHPGEYVLLGVGLVAAFGALTYITRVAKAALAKSGSAPVAAPLEDSKAV